ncbi:MAG: hypothetical protein WC413_03790 [Candidatus Nanoarchaeia archaeon]
MDAFSHIARDQNRNELYKQYLEKLYNYLTKKGDYNSLEDITKKLDSVGDGYFGSKTNLSKNLKDFIKKLEENDKETWLKFLVHLPECDWSPEHGGVKEYYKMFKEISAFKNDALIKIDYGSGFVDIELKDLEEIMKKHNSCTMDCDKYILVLPLKSLEDINVLWAGNGTRYQDKDGKWVSQGPRNYNKKPKKD